ncbi:aldehyde dehydrogenase [Coniophora puteana RWD-64-598 SS2]|uniref:Aldehyde dehydrogenase n=1 Tax=Coniophora puteana (strain RWD-64-598) TaxID=741705 RepID=A0A5M3MLB0_CONPW|nr:aldehyde dehydrogenase [Coniophora puteana RWD-64-598 SS2]EIW79883.1 aldehyde dehydrogenase [Coniophora puteana RWD-64-598 SS2]
MPGTSFSYDFSSKVYTGKTSFKTGVFINNEFRDGSEGTTIDIMNPVTGGVLTQISEGTAQDVDTAVQAAKAALATTWGLKCPGAKRSLLMNKLANLMEEHHDELSALEAVDVGKTFNWAKNADVAAAIATIRYYAGWADKILGQVIETTEAKLAYTRHEPIGVVGQILPWNFPLLIMCWKLGPALATGNTAVIKPAEVAPLSCIRMCELIVEAGFPAGVVNMVTGYGHTVGTAITAHNGIEMVSFTGSTFTGGKVMENAANSNIKDVTLELGGKGPCIVLEDADIDKAANWAAFGVFWSQGQVCCAGSRIFVQESIYEKFIARFTQVVRSIKAGDPFGESIWHGPQASQQHFDRIMGYIQSGKDEGATVAVGGNRIGTEGYFIEPTVFTDVNPNMRVVKEEIFGPVAVVLKFKDQADAIRQGNDTEYGLSAAIFSENITKAIETAHQMQAGMTFINCNVSPECQVPFGGIKKSGIGRELGEYALRSYYTVKAVHVNLGLEMNIG